MPLTDAFTLWVETHPRDEDDPRRAPPVALDIAYDAWEPDDRTGVEEDAAVEAEAIEPVFTTIEYRADGGGFSRRRITFRRFKAFNTGMGLYAFCHERKAVRLFRCDRIEAFIDDDGVVLAPAAFWDMIGIDLDALRSALGAPDVGPSKAETRLHPQLVLLAAIARCDGWMRDVEIDRIVDYALDEMERDGDMTSPEMQAALRQRVRRLRPTQSTIQTATRDLFGDRWSALDPAAKARFRRAAHNVANADRVLQPEEFAFLLALEEHVG